MCPSDIQNPEINPTPVPAAAPDASKTADASASRSKEAMIRNAGKRRYANAANVRRKWLTQYGRVDAGGDYQRNKSVLFELFNLLDLVMDNRLSELRSQAKRLEDREIKGRINQCWELDGKIACFRDPKFYSERIYALEKFGLQLPEEINEGTRFLRNDLTHGSETVLLQYVNLDLTNMKKHLTGIGEALCTLGMLDQSEIVPDFELLRIHPGDTLNGGAYRVGRLIGEGGMSRVYEGTQRNLDRRIAIKELKPDTYAGEVIRNECAALVKLRHPLIPRIIDTFSQNMTYYIVMEYIDGVNLSRYVRENRPGDIRRKRILLELCDVLSYLHNEKTRIVFCDLKPENVMIDGEGRPNLIDFGISRSAASRAVQTHASAVYTAPEVLEGKPARASADIYALGLMIKFLFPNPAPALQAVIDVCTQTLPERRFSTAGAVKNALETAWAQPVGAASPAGSGAEAVQTSPPNYPASQSAAPNYPASQSAARPAVQQTGTVLRQLEPDQTMGRAGNDRTIPRSQQTAGQSQGPAAPEKDRSMILVLSMVIVVVVLLAALLILLVLRQGNSGTTAAIRIPIPGPGPFVSRSPNLPWGSLSHPWRP